MTREEFIRHWANELGGVFLVDTFRAREPGEAPLQMRLATFVHRLESTIGRMWDSQHPAKPPQVPSPNGAATRPQVKT